MCDIVRVSERERHERSSNIVCRVSGVGGRRMLASRTTLRFLASVTTSLISTNLTPQCFSLIHSNSSITVAPPLRTARKDYQGRANDQAPPLSRAATGADGHTKQPHRPTSKCVTSTHDALASASLVGLEYRLVGSGFLLFIHIHIHIHVSTFAFPGFIHITVSLVSVPL